MNMLISLYRLIVALAVPAGAAYVGLAEDWVAGLVFFGVMAVFVGLVTGMTETLIGLFRPRSRPTD